MSVVEVMAFRLTPGSNEEEFVQADSEMQSDFMYRQPGLIRRTTARDEEGNWVVVSLWSSLEQAQSCDLAKGEDRVVRGFASFVDPGSIRVKRFSTLD